MKKKDRCDGKSAGVIVRKGTQILLIERKKFPPAFALPAGHCDGDAFKKTAARELWEETGLTAQSLKEVFQRPIATPCRRGGKKHSWRVYEARSWRGKLMRSQSETKAVFWASPKTLAELAHRTVAFAKKLKTSMNRPDALTRALAKNKAWQKKPGLEVTWYIILQKLGLLEK